MNIEDISLLNFLQSRLPGTYSSPEVKAPEGLSTNITPLEIIVCRLNKPLDTTQLPLLLADYTLRCGYDITVKMVEPYLFQHEFSHIPKLPARFLLKANRDEERMIYIMYYDDHQMVVSSSGTLDVTAFDEW